MEKPSDIQRRDVRFKTRRHRTYRHRRRHTRHAGELHRLEKLRYMRGGVHRIIFQENRTICHNRNRSRCRIIGLLRDNHFQVSLVSH